MIKLFSQLFTKGVIAALLSADTQTAVALLQEHLPELKDPFAGASMQAELLYYAIKKTNTPVVNFILNITPDNNLDVPFFHHCGNTPVGLAMEENYQEVLTKLLFHSDKNFVLQTAVKLNQIALVSLLLHKFAYKDKFLQFLGLEKNRVGIA